MLYVELKNKGIYRLSMTCVELFSRRLERSTVFIEGQRIAKAVPILPWACYAT